MPGVCLCGACPGSPSPFLVVPVDGKLSSVGIEAGEVPSIPGAPGHTGAAGAGVTGCCCPPACWPACVLGCALCSTCAPVVNPLAFEPGAGDWPCGALAEGAIVTPLAGDAGVEVCMTGVLADGAGATVEPVGAPVGCVPVVCAQTEADTANRHTSAAVNNPRKIVLL